RSPSPALVQFAFGQGNFAPYDPVFTAGAFVAAGPVISGYKDYIVTTPDLPGGPDLRVYDDSHNQSLPTQISSFHPYDNSFTGGVRLAVADTNGDGQAEIITAPGPGGGPDVRVFTYTGIMTGEVIAFDGGFTGGVY